MGGTEHTIGITKVKLSLQLNPDNIKNASFMKVKAIVIEAKSYDILVGSKVLYPMGFTLEFWKKKASYRPGWQAGDECGNTDSNFFALDPKIVPKLGNLRFGNSKTRETGW
jgi:hypothetical protein